MLEGRGQAGRIRLVPRQVLALASAEIRDRYLGSVLGLLWAIIHPLVLILLYVFVFSVVLKVKIGGEGDAEEYGLFLFAGIIPWRMVQDILIRAPGTYLERANLLEKIPMSPLVVPMSLVLVCLFNLVVDLSVFVTVLLVLGRSLAPLVILLLPLTISIGLLTLGISLIVGNLNVRYRDTAQVCQVASVLWFLASPIIYPAELVPARLQWIIAGNPISGMIGLFRHALLGLPAPSSAAIGLTSAFVVIGFGAGWCWHVKTGKDLLDHL